ncbi:MBL fold metallo-hydrolase [Staphylococcus shinii]|uniref:MBL fold metallo-hydrolase n=1 Tax=Staphylococcus shinii TaxID=2912228 RepID=UPI003F55A82C
MVGNMSYGKDYKFIPITSIENKQGIEVTNDLYQYTTQIVNIVMYGHSKNDFVLIDAGMPNSAQSIIEEVEKRFGPGSRPQAIVLTHGHFDHVGAIIELINYWDVVVYAHPLEIPFLTGKVNYLKPDITVEGGLLAKTSFILPNTAIDLGNRIKALPEDYSVPHMSEFQWIHTPGHSPGHVSLYREKDGALIAGDAFVTVKQDYLYQVLTQQKKIYGPPRYFTTDWESAFDSIKKLESIQPKIAITGHGLPMKSKELTKNLNYLVNNFDDIALPKHGKYLE